MTALNGGSALSTSPPTTDSGGSGATAELRVPTAHDFPRCRACQMWKDAGASWPRPCKQHYGGEPND